MDVESRVDGALRRAGDAVQPDLADALREVRAQARRRTSRRRVVIAGGVVTVAVVAGVLARLGAAGPDTAPDPAAPPRDHAAALTLVRDVSASSLGLRKLLSAAVAPNGHVYVTDTSQRVAELGPDLEVIRTWGASGTAAGRFRMVQGSIAVDSQGRVYVSDTGNFRIQVFTANGRYLRSVGEYGNGPAQFTWPFDLALDGDGNIYLADDKEETLTKLSPSGEQLWRRGGLGETDPRLQGHAHLASFDQQGRLLVVIDDKGLVVRMDTDGRVVDSVDAQARPTELCDASAGPTELVYLAACLEPWVVRVVEPDGTLVGTWDDAELVQAPRWTPDGRGYAVMSDGGLAEVRAGS